MKVRRPIERRKFANDWDEIGYLYDKLLYWLYQREDSSRSRRYAKRLEPLLRRAAPDHQAIFGEECWSLVYETKGDLRSAIKHRQNEIRLIRRLHNLPRQTAPEELVRKDYGYDDLSDRLDLLAVLYHDSGNIQKAISTLLESKQLCGQHGIKFDGEDILLEYLQEENRNGTPHSPPRKQPQARWRVFEPARVSKQL